jgi:hypothetical protein
MRCADDLGDFREQAARLLRRALGEDAALRTVTRIKDGARCGVFRCEVSAASANVASVILKRMKPVPEAERAFTDWASLAFLSRLPGTQGIAPRFYGGDPEQGIYAIEDLGGSRSLEDVLTGSDPAALRQALTALAVQSARLHVHTMGQEEEFSRLRRALPQDGGPDRRREAEKWLAGRAAIREWFDAARCPLPAGFDHALERIAGVYAEPGPYLAFTHGDPAPTNNHLAGEDVRLLDFEFGGFRHALYDLTAWYVLCPLPEYLVGPMSRSYRVALAAGCPAAGDEACYREAWASLCAFRALAMLTWIPRETLAQNKSWVGDWTRREAVLSAVLRLHAATAVTPTLAAVAEAAARLEQALRSRWPEYNEVFPRWPALAASGSEPIPGL